MTPTRTTPTLIIAITAITLLLLLLPPLLAYRYTAPQQRGVFITQPWRGWSFVLTALRVPGDSKLKTSGMALRKADWVLHGTAIDPNEVELLFVEKKEPYTLEQRVAGRTVKTTVRPSYRFIWQVHGKIRTLPDHRHTIVLLLDYATGRVLYDVRTHLTPSQIAPPSMYKTPSSTAAPKSKQKSDPR